MINIQWTKFEQNSIGSFISGELPNCLKLITTIALANNTPNRSLEKFVIGFLRYNFF